MNPVQTHMHAKQKKNGIQISKENCEQSETHTQKKTMETMKAMAQEKIWIIYGRTNH